MNDDSWFKQTKDPMFPDIIWSKPEHKSKSGRVLVIGGSKNNLHCLSQAYQNLTEAKVGALFLIAPDSLKKQIQPLISEAEFVPSTKLGSISEKSLSTIKSFAERSDAIFICGDLSHNSETTSVVENVVNYIKAPIIVTDDGLDAISNLGYKLMTVPDLFVVGHFDKLQKLASQAGAPKAITSTMGIVQLVETLNKLSRIFQPIIITDYEGKIVVTHKGRTSTTPIENKDWTQKLSAILSTMAAQNLGDPFEMATTAAFEAKKY